MTRVLIQAVPWEQSRVKNAVALARAVGEGAEIVWDEQHSGFETFLKVLRTAGDDAFILLEDDVELGANWHERIAEEIAARPDVLIRGFTTKDLIYGSRLVRGDYYSYNQCTYFPAGYAKAILEWLGDRRPKSYLEFHDFVVKRFLSSRDEQFWQVVPTLVQHKPFESVVDPSRRRSRQSTHFEGA